MFRVHTVIPSSPSAIPAGKVIIVLEIGDSPAAPHQSTRDKKYYHRAAGRSEPAGHFYLELLRQRLTNASLEYEILGFTPCQIGSFGTRFFLEAKLRFKVNNIGRVAAYKWALAVSHPTNPQYPELAKDVFIHRENFPVILDSSGGIRLDDTILPGMSMLHDLHIGFLLTSTESSQDELMSSFESTVCKSIVAIRMATETSPGVFVPHTMGDLISAESLVDFAVARNLVRS